MPQNGAWAPCSWPAKETEHDGKPGDGFWYPIFKQAKTGISPKQTLSLSQSPNLLLIQVPIGLSI